MSTATLQMTDAQQDVATVTFQDSNGATVPIVGVPVWASDDTAGAIATVTPAADGMSATIVGIAPGVVNLTITAQGDPTAGVDVVTVQGTVTIVADEATQGTLVFGTPTAKS